MEIFGSFGFVPYLCTQYMTFTNYEQVRDSFFDSMHTILWTTLCDDTASGIPVSA